MRPLLPLLLVAALAGCTAPQDEAKAFVEKITSEVAPLSRESALAYWEATATGKKELYDRYAELTLATRRIYSDRDGFEKARRLRDSDVITDPLLERQLEVLYLAFLENQVPPELTEEMVRLASDIEARFNTHRAELDGEAVSDNALAEIMKTERDVNRRRAAWEASKAVGAEVAEDVLRLVRLRNRAARELGFDNYYELQLALTEIDVDELFAIFDELQATTEEPFSKMKGRIDTTLAARYAVAPEELRPWHYQDVFFQEVQDIAGVDMDAQLATRDVREIAQSFFAGIGLDVGAILERSDLYEREGKYQHAYSIDIDREGDVRTMDSLRNNRYWLETLLHELGHGVYSAHIDRSLPWLLREEAHMFTTEAVAELFGGLPTRAEWLKKAAGMPPEVADAWAPALEDERRMGQLIFSRWSQVMIRFERALYENPDGDLNALWWDLVEAHQHLRRPEGRDAPDWAAKIHLAVYPVYYHNYMLGRLLTAQLEHHIASEVLGAAPPLSLVDRPEVGAYLIESVFAPGKRHPWKELVVRATGEPLTARYFAESVTE